jgi:uncharacterized protein YutE (UPF0331/DUF86 family)
MKAKASEAGDRNMLQIERLLAFLVESLEYFESRMDGVDLDRYFADRDIRSILDKTINDIILCIVDLSEEILKAKQRVIPDTYRDTILSCHEFIGEIALSLAPLVRHRNEMVHQYTRVNWQNIIAVKHKVGAIRSFADAVKTVVACKHVDKCFS